MFACPAVATNISRTGVPVLCYDCMPRNSTKEEDADWFQAPVDADESAWWPFSSGGRSRMLLGWASLLTVPAHLKPRVFFEWAGPVVLRRRCANVVISDHVASPAMMGGAGAVEMVGLAAGRCGCLACFA